jgi:hypothetical protein
MAQLLRPECHTATNKQSQGLVEAVNRHMPATPALGNRHFATMSISASQSTLAAFCRGRQATPVQLLDAIIPRRRLSALAM